MIIFIPVGSDYSDWIFLINILLDFLKLFLGQTTNIMYSESDPIRKNPIRVTALLYIFRYHETIKHNDLNYRSCLSCKIFLVINMKTIMICISDLEFGNPIPDQHLSFLNKLITCASKNSNLLRTWPSYSIINLGVLPLWVIIFWTSW